jgi:hypothetical protein
MYARAVVYARAGRADRAVSILDDAIGLENDAARKAAALRMRTHFNFQKGDRAAGWRDADLAAQQEAKSRPEIQRYWIGEDLSGRSLCLHAWAAPSAKIGLGDFIWFARFLPALVERCASVHCPLHTGLKLMPLLQPSSPGVNFESGSVRDADFHCHLRSLPHRIGCDAAPKIPYLEHDEERAERWARVLGTDGFKIGIAWSAHHESRVNRSFPLREFEVLSRLAGVRLISLQKDDGIEQLSELPNVEVCDGLDEGAAAFLDTAAVMAHLDLIVSCDTSVANLAGALGRPTWIALNHRPQPRWIPMADIGMSYPTVRPFCQKVPDDWSSVFSDMAQELSRLLEGRATPERGQR